MKCCSYAKYKLEKPAKYEYHDTGSGIWKSYTHEDGVKFGEYTSHFCIGETPFLSIAYGPNPETGKMAVADGFVAIGQRAKGFVAIGQFVSGYFSVGQFATARVAGIGQFVAAPLALSQFAIAVAGIGQMGLVGTGIFQSATMFFGGIGQKVWDLSSYFVF